jgi:hypothetical protein
MFTLSAQVLGDQRTVSAEQDALGVTVTTSRGLQHARNLNDALRLARDASASPCEGASAPASRGGSASASRVSRRTTATCASARARAAAAVGSRPPNSSSGSAAAGTTTRVRPRPSRTRWTSSAPTSAAGQSVARRSPTRLDEKADASRRLPYRPGNERKMREHTDSANDCSWPESPCKWAELQWQNRTTENRGALVRVRAGRLVGIRFRHRRDVLNSVGRYKRVPNRVPTRLTSTIQPHSAA